MAIIAKNQSNPHIATEQLKRAIDSPKGRQLYRLLEYSFGDQVAMVEFTEVSDGVNIRVAFDADTTHSIEQQQSGWQAILIHFARHVEGHKWRAGS